MVEVGYICIESPKRQVQPMLDKVMLLSELND